MSSLFLGSFIVLAGSWCAELGCWKGCCKPGKLVALPLLSAYLLAGKWMASTNFGAMARDNFAIKECSRRGRRVGVLECGNLEARPTLTLSRT